MSELPLVDGPVLGTSRGRETGGPRRGPVGDIVTVADGGEVAAVG